MTDNMTDIVFYVITDCSQMKYIYKDIINWGINHYASCLNITLTTKEKKAVFTKIINGIENLKLKYDGSLFLKI